MKRPNPSHKRPVVKKSFVWVGFCIAEDGIQWYMCNGKSIKNSLHTLHKKILFWRFCQCPFNVHSNYAIIRRESNILSSTCFRHNIQTIDDNNTFVSVMPICGKNKITIQLELLIWREKIAHDAMGNDKVNNVFIVLIKVLFTVSYNRKKVKWCLWTMSLLWLLKSKSIIIF